MKYCNGGQKQESKTRTKLVYPSVWSQPRGKSDYRILERIALKAYLQVESNTDGWMDGACIHKTNTSEYL